VILGVVRLACDALPDVEIVAEASSGPAAVEAASSLTPDLAVVDLDLPGIDGVTVLRALRDRGFAGRIVVVSERTDGATVLDAMKVSGRSMRRSSRPPSSSSDGSHGRRGRARRWTRR